MLVATLLFLLGFVLLIKGADWLVEGSGSIAKRFRIPDIVIGLTIVSFGTSAPELIVNLMATYQGSSDIALGNVFGSNIANVLLILGVSALIYPLPINKNTYLIEIPFSLTAVLLVGFLANANLFEASLISAGAELYISRFDGVILLFFFALFMGYIYSVAARKEAVPREVEDINQLPNWKSWLFIVIGITGLGFGGHWVVSGAQTFARELGMSESFIGLTIIAIGTSLPELVTSATAALRKNADIAVGNVVGSNIFNLLWIIGISAAIKDLPFRSINNAEVLMIVFATSMLILATAIGRNTSISRTEGGIFVVTYLGYLIFLALRETPALG